MYTFSANTARQKAYSIIFLRLLLVVAIAVPLALSGGASPVSADPLGPEGQVLDLGSSTQLEGSILSTPTGLTCSAIESVPTTNSTGDKPQSKVWNYDGYWFSVFPTSITGASLPGTWIWRLDGTSWTEVLRISENTDTQADVKISGDLAHIMLYSGSPEFITVEYGSGAYHSWATYPDLVPLTLSGSRTVTIDLDSTGRLWLTAHDSLGTVYVRYSDTPYNVWSGNIDIASGVQAMDIEAVIALPNDTIGVMWSNQNTKRFGFKYHNDADDPAVWSTDEAPGASVAHDEIGLGQADDHINLAVASDSTLYAAIKTGYDKAGYPKIGLMIRRPNGVWDNGIYTVDEQGSRPIVLLNEVDGILSFFYTSDEGYYSILYKQTATDPISFGPRTTLATNSFNNASGMKANYTDDLVVIYSSSSEVDGQYCIPTPATGADLQISKTDNEVSTRPGATVIYTIAAFNNGPDAVTDAVVTDTLPAALLDATWTCAGSNGGSCTASGTGSINELVDLPVGGSVVFTVTATVDAEATGSIENTASIAPPGGVTDPLLSNNSITDSDRIVIPGTPCEANAALVGCWQMEENGGIDMVDGSSYINDGILYDSPIWGAGKVGSYALDLDGASQFGLVPDDASLDITGQITLAAWIKPEIYANQVLIKKATTSVSDGYEIALASTQTEPLNRKVFFRINRATSGDTLRLNSTSYYPMDGLTWIHVAATFDGTTMRLYVNGALEGSLVAPPGTLIGSNNVPLTVGAEYNATRYFKGWLDDVRVYNTALSEADVQGLYGNHLPVAVDDTYSTNEDTLLDVVVPGVLTNDTDLDLLDPKTAVLVGNAAHGTLTLNADGSFTYMPDPDWNGSDLFSYKVFDGKDYGNTATVSITVNAVDDLVTLNPIGNQTVDELTLLTFTATAVNVDPTDTLTYSLSGAPTGAAIDSTTGVFTWTPTEEQGPGGYPFDVCVTDGITPVCETIIVTVYEVNAAPVLAPIGNQFAVQDTLLSFTAVATDADIPADVLTYSLVGAPVGAAINSSTGLFTWTPTAAQVGDHTFTVRVCDNDAAPLCDEELITVDVAEAFAITVLDLQQSTDQVEWTDVYGSIGAGYHMGLDPALEFEYLDVQSLTSNRPVAEGLHPFYLDTTSLPTGFYAYWAAKGVSAGAGVGTWQEWMYKIITGTEPMFYLKVSAGPAYTLIDGLQWDFFSTEGYLRISGDYPLGTYTFDGTIESSVGDTSLVTAQMTFEAMPEITALSLEQSNDKTTWTPLTGTLGGGYEMALDLLQTFQYIDVASLAANKTLNDGLHPFYLDTTSLPAGFYEYWGLKGVTAGAGVGTWQEWMYKIVTGVEPMFYLKVSGSTYKLVDGLSMDYFSTEEYLRVNGDYPLGTYAFDGEITDTIYETSPLTAAITFTRYNHAPVADSQSVTTPEDTPLGITLTASDVESDLLTWTIVSQPVHGVLTGAAPNLTYTPAADYAGSDSFTFKVNDGLLDSNIATVSITVTPVNDAPVLVAIGAQSVNELVLLSFTALATDVDLPPDSLTFSLADGAAGLVPSGAGITSGGAFTWTPTEAQGPGSYTFDVCVSDSALSDCETITVTVAEVNLAPVVDAITDKTVAEGSLLAFTAAVTDADLPANTLTFSLVGAPTGASIDPATGAFSWTPTDLQSPNDYTFVVKVCDNGAPPFCGQTNVNVTVTEVNVAPELSLIDGKTVDELTLLTFVATAIDPDLPANTLTFSLANGAAGLVPAGASITAGGTFTWTPSEAQGGLGLPYIFDVCVSDGTASDCETINVTVTEVGVAPVAVADSYNVAVNTTLNVDAPGVLANDSDADIPADALTAVLVTSTAHGTLTFNADGSFTYTPDAGWFENDSFTYKVTDGVHDSNVVTVTISIDHVHLYLPMIGR